MPVTTRPRVRPSVHRLSLSPLSAVAARCRCRSPVNQSIHENMLTRLFLVLCCVSATTALAIRFSPSRALIIDRAPTNEQSAWHRIQLPIYSS